MPSRHCPRWEHSCGHGCTAVAVSVKPAPPPCPPRTPTHHEYDPGRATVAFAEPPPSDDGSDRSLRTSTTWERGASHEPL
eukprot:957872-Prorocentrum_minimum.AAC.1